MLRATEVQDAAGDDSLSHLLDCADQFLSLGFAPLCAKRSKRG